MDLVRGLKVRFPKVHIKAFTMVEVAFLAKRGKMTIPEALERMKEAGVGTRCRGAGRRSLQTAYGTLSAITRLTAASGWIRLGQRIRSGSSNATMLYGHVENDEDRVDHLIKLREVQDETGGIHVYPAGVSSGEYGAGAHSEDDRDDGPAADCDRKTDAGQFSAHQELLADGLAEDGADLASVRCRCDIDGTVIEEEDLSRCRRRLLVGMRRADLVRADYGGGAGAVSQRSSDVS